MLKNEFEFQADNEKYHVVQLDEDEVEGGDDDPTTNLYEVTRKSDGEKRRVFFNAAVPADDFKTYVKDNAYTIFRPIAPIEDETLTEAGE